MFLWAGLETAPMVAMQRSSTARCSPLGSFTNAYPSAPACAGVCQRPPAFLEAPRAPGGGVPAGGAPPFRPPRPAGAQSRGATASSLR